MKTREALARVSLCQFVKNDIGIFRSHLRWIFLMLTGEVAAASCGRIAVFVEPDGNIDLAREGRALHHDVFLVEGVIQWKRRLVDFFDGEGRAAWAAAGGSGDDE